jgi:methionyl aminopeptidase
MKVDVTAALDGYIADAATTILLPPVNAIDARLKQAASAALTAALSSARAGERVSACRQSRRSRGKASDVAVVRELYGHGVGRQIHEQPAIPNCEDRFSRDVLTEGLVIAVEPMLVESPSRAVQAADGWTVRTRNRCLAAHEEHTLVVTASAPLIFTAEG